MISKQISLAALATAVVAGSFMIGSASIAKAESGAIPAEGGGYFNEAELQNEARQGPPSGSGMIFGFADPMTAAAYGPGARAYGFTNETIGYGYAPGTTAYGYAPAPLAFGAAIPGTLAYGAAAVPGTLAYGAAVVPGTLAYGAAGYPTGYGPYAWAGPTDPAAAIPMPGVQGPYAAVTERRVVHHPIKKRARVSQTRTSTTTPQY